jgi:hypothetical protein
VGRDRDDADVVFETGAGEFGLQEGVDLVDAGGVGHLDLDEHRDAVAGFERDFLDRLTRHGVDPAPALLVGRARAAMLHVERVGDPNGAGLQCQRRLRRVMAEDRVEHLALDPDARLGVVKVELGEDAIEDVGGEWDRVVGVVLAVDDVADVVEGGGERGDDRLVGLVEVLVGCTVELDAPGLEQVVETERTVADDRDVLGPVVVVTLARHRIDVLGVEIGLYLRVALDEVERFVDSLVGEGVVVLGGVDATAGRIGAVTHGMVFDSRNENPSGCSLLLGGDLTVWARPTHSRRPVGPLRPERPPRPRRSRVRCRDRRSPTHG